jgi:hypothetical protein
VNRFYRLNLLGDHADDDLALIDAFVEGDGLSMEHYRMSLGEPAMGIWPRDAFVGIRAGGGRRLSDLVGATTGHITVSGRFVEVVNRCLTPHDVVEFLPVSLKDSRGRIIASDYFIVNPIGTLDCLDVAASDVDLSASDPLDVLHVETPVLAADKVAESRTLFRIQEAPTIYVLAYSLAFALKSAGLANVFWTRIELR